MFFRSSLFTLHSSLFTFHFSLPKPIPPEPDHLLVLFFFRGRVLCVPEPSVLQFVGHILLIDKIARIIVSILISVMVAKLLHQFCRGVTKV